MGDAPTIAVGAAVLLRLSLAGVLLWAAGRKLLDRAGTAASAANLGVPTSMAGAVGVALPLVEVACATLLLLGPPAAATPSALLFAVFLLVVWRAVRRGHAVQCACFGAGHGGSVSWWTVARNLALTAAAALMALIPAPGLPTVLAAWTAPAALAGAALVSAAAGVVIAGMAGAWRSELGLRQAVDVDRIHVTGLDGVEVPLRRVLAGRPRVVLFVEPRCGPCRALVPRLPPPDAADAEPLVVISAGPSAEAAEVYGRQRPDVLVDVDGGAAQALGRPATPGAVVLLPSGRLASSWALGAPSVLELLAGRSAEPPGRTDAASPRSRRQVLRGYGVAVAVRGPSQLLDDLTLDDLPGTGWSAPTDAVVAEISVEGEGPWCIYRDGLEVASATTMHAAAEIALQHIELLVAEHATTHVFVHAGVVTVGGRAIVLPGASHAGKTSLVMALVRRGARYASDEFALLDPDGGAHPYPRRPRLRAVAGSGRGAPNPVPSVVQEESAPVAMVVVAEYEGGAEWAPRAMTPGEAALALMANAVAARRRPEAVLDAATAAVAEAILITGRRGEADEVAARLIDHLGGLAAPATQR